MKRKSKRMRREVARLLRARFNSMFYVSDLPTNVISEMCDIQKEIDEVLLKDKMTNL